MDPGAPLISNLFPLTPGLAEGQVGQAVSLHRLQWQQVHPGEANTTAQRPGNNPIKLFFITDQVASK